MPWTCKICGCEAGMLGCSNPDCGKVMTSFIDMSNRPTREKLTEELLERERLEDRDEHVGLTRDIVQYLFKHYKLERKSP